MTKVMTATFLLLFWAFYEMSGGADFEPSQRDVASAAPWDANQSDDQIMDVPAKLPAENKVMELRSAGYEVIQASLDSNLEMSGVMPPVADEVVEVEVVAKVELRSVIGNRVNMRNGPGTNHRVLKTLSRGRQAEVIAVDSDGWAQIRLIDGGDTGWMVERLLSDVR